MSKKPKHHHQKVYYKRVYPRRPGAFNPEPLVRYGWTCADENGECGDAFETWTIANLDLDEETRRLLA